MSNITRRGFLHIASAAAVSVTALDGIEAVERQRNSNTRNLKDGWLVQSSAVVQESGESLSHAGFEPEGWYRTAIPSTVLSALVKNKVYPDPRLSLNAYQIPDSSDEFNAQHDLAKFSHLPDHRNPWRDPWWYRTEFSLDSVPLGRRLWLHFDAINYRADVWLNGRQIAGRKKMAGMFQRFQFDVTGQVKPGRNGLAVKIYPVDHTGTPDTQLEVLGRTRSQFKENARDVTENYTIGYDCMMTVPDRNMGIWQNVWIEWTGPVDIRNPFIVTDLPLPEANRATLTVSAELVNAIDAPVKGTLRGSIPATEVMFEQTVELGSREMKTVTIDPRPIIMNPRLWWPVNYGEQYLYDMNLQFETGGALSVEKKVTFGVRKITTELHEVNGWHGRRVMINGQKVLCRGGWVQPELLMDWDAQRMDDEIRYYAEANLNLIYCCDVSNLPDSFLESCDRRGVMFGNCFYDDYPDFPKEACNFSECTHLPDDLGLLESCTVDVIKRYRNHPSLVMYLCMVERTPPEDVYVMWRRNILRLDGTRWFIPSEYFPSDRKDAPEWTKQDLPTGMNDWRPKSYGWEEPVTYFQWVRDCRNWMFMMESGTASVPPISSLSRFMPNATTRNHGEELFPLQPVWAHHGANHYYKPCDAALRRQYGEPESVVEYCWKQHFVTADQNRAMFEAVNHRLWDITSGFTQWKINSCEPSIQWQMFDWYHKPMVSWYYIKKACEPLHVQLNAPDHMVSIINTRFTAQADLEVRARVFDLSGRLLWEKTDRASVEANSYRETFTVPEPGNGSSVYLVKLELKDAQNRRLCDNFYWLPAKETGYAAMNSMSQAKLDATYKVETHGVDQVARVKLSNPTHQIAVFVQLALTQGRGGAEILPVIWEDNYFTLVPGETREVAARFANHAGGQPVLEVGGWNIQTGYRCTALALSKNSVKVGEQLNITASISETFLDGSRVSLLVDGEPGATKWAWARENRADKLLFNLSFSKPGLHRLAVAERQTQVTVT